MSDGDATWRARLARTRASRHEAPAEGRADGPTKVTRPGTPLVRRGTPPPLLFQVDTVDPWTDSHPGQSLHSGARHEIDAAFERALGPAYDPTTVALRGVASPVVEPAPDDVLPFDDLAPAEVVPAVEVTPSVEVPEPTVIEPTVVELPHTTPEFSASETTMVLPPIEGTVPAPPTYVPPSAAMAPAPEEAVLESPVAEEPVAEEVAEEPVAEEPVAEEPVAEEPEPLVVEPPVYVPPTAAAPLVLEPPTPQAAEPAVEPPEPEVAPEPFVLEPPVYEAPKYVAPVYEAPVPTPAVVEPPAEDLTDEIPTFWSPPTGPTPRFFTPEGVPSAPVSLSKSAEIDPWFAALQPEAPPFGAEHGAAEDVVANDLVEEPVPAEPRPASWFDGGHDPFGFATDFGTPGEPWREELLGPDADGLSGRHRTDGEAAPARGRRRAGTRAKTAKPSRKAPWWELPALVALAIVIAVVVKSFVVQPFYIPSPSMERTLHGCTGCAGDRILVNKPIYDFRDPHPGDIVVFHAPPGWNEEQGSKPPSNPILRAGRGFLQLVGFVPPDGLVLVKRVIAVGGQTVKGVSIDGGASEQIMISDHGPGGPWRTLKEPYVYIDAPDTNANFGPVTIPAHRLWVMGDHRNDSADSRYHCGVGTSGPAGTSACDSKSSTVPVDDVIGKAFVIAWPPSRWRTLGTPSTFGAGVVLPLFFIRRRRRRRQRA